MAKHSQKYYHKQMDTEAGLAHKTHRTKIVATVGPACDTYDKLLELVKAGVNVFRLNFSHGSHEDKTRIIESIRLINKTEPFNIAILGDLQGPKLRVGEIENGEMQIVAGDILTFTNEKLIGTKERIYVSYPNLHEDVVIGNTIMINDGKLEVKVKKVLPNNDVQVEVTMGGLLSSKKGINLPDTKISLPALCKHIRMICFCNNGIFSTGSSTPKSPRAIITASDATMISLKFSRASGFSILEIIFVLLCFNSNLSRKIFKSFTCLTNDKATQSNFCSIM